MGCSAHVVHALQAAQLLGVGGHTGPAEARHVQLDRLPRGKAAGKALQLRGRVRVVQVGRRGAEPVALLRRAQTAGCQAMQVVQL